MLKAVVLKAKDKCVPEFVAEYLLRSRIISVTNGCCQGTCRHQSAEERTTSTQLVFPYRGVYVRHLGQDQTVAEANQVLFFNGYEGYRISHPVPGGDASLTLMVCEELLRELTPTALLCGGCACVSAAATAH